MVLVFWRWRIPLIPVRPIITAYQMWSGCGQVQVGFVCGARSWLWVTCLYQWISTEYSVLRTPYRSWKCPCESVIQNKRWLWLVARWPHLCTVSAEVWSPPLPLLSLVLICDFCNSHHNPTLHSTDYYSTSPRPEPIAMDEDPWFLTVGAPQVDTESIILYGVLRTVHIYTHLYWIQYTEPWIKGFR